MTSSTKQKVYYHVKVLEKEGLIQKVEERRVGGIMEGMYQATARCYWLSPRLIGLVGGQRRTRDQMSLGFILSLAEELQNDIGQLAVKNDEEIPSFGLSAHVRLKDQDERAQFMAEIQGAIKSIAAKYGATGEEVDDHEAQQFRLMLACYPAAETETEVN